MRSASAAAPAATGGLGGVLEDAVLDQFAVEAAVVGVIDLFGHKTVETGAERHAGLIDVDGQFAGIGG